MSGVAALALVGLVVGWSYNAQLKEESRKAVEARGAADIQRGRAEAEFSRAKTYLYFNQIALAAHAWQLGSVANAERYLEECPPELRGWEWEFFKRSCHPEMMTLRGHRGEVWGVAYSPDGRLIASVSLDRTLRIWDASLGGLIRDVPLSGMGWSVAFNRDGKRVATLSADPGRPGRLTIWDVETGREIRSHAGIYGHCPGSPSARTAPGSPSAAGSRPTRGSTSGSRRPEATP